LQLLRSNWVFTQLLPHLVSPVLQVQTPLLQPTIAAEPTQAFPQAPQLFRSEFKSRHNPRQLVRPTLHWQVPATQN
jgi:hypothetical protein